MQFLFINLFMLMIYTAQAAEIQVSVDRNPVSVNDSFQIIFTANENPDGNPDFSPLQTNFEILDQQRSSNSSWVNGQSSRTEQWVVSVLAKQSGDLLIPPINFGADVSKPLKITVSNNQHVTQNNDDLFLEVTAAPEKPYVQSQVLYTLRLYRRVQIAQARIDEPQIKDAVVEKLGDDSTYSTQINGIDYAVTERKYAIFPQQSGVITIEPLTLNAEVLVQHRPRFNGFFNQQSTETRRVVSQPITLNVLPVPAAFKNGEWLSAESLQIKEEWSGKSMQTKVGEPLTRTLRITAKGSTVGQLPELLSHTDMDGIKTYPDQPVLKEDKLADGLTAIREEKVAFIPSKAGDFTLPPIEIKWFNTKTQQVETASLPGATIKAEAIAEQKPQQPSISAVEKNSQALAAMALDNQSADIRLWQGISAGLALGWLLTAALLFYRRQKPAAQTTPKEEKLSESAIEKALKSACSENNAQAAKQQLLRWGKTRFGVESLAAIAQQCTEPLRAEIVKLNQLLYSGQQHTWSGNELWLAYKALQISPSANSQADDSLEPLYKL